MKTESPVVRFRNPKTSTQVRQFQDRVTRCNTMSQSRLQTSKKRCQVDCTAPSFKTGSHDVTRCHRVVFRHQRKDARLTVLHQVSVCPTRSMSDFIPFWCGYLIQFIWFGLLMYTHHQLLAFLISILRASFWFRNELLHLICGTKCPTETLPSEWRLVQKSSKRQDSTQDSWKKSG